MADCYETMLFNYETTNRTDFRNGEINPVVKTLYQKRPHKKSIKTSHLKDIHTLSEWKNTNVPFDILIKVKDIVRSNPRQVQQPYARPTDIYREEVQRTRPRLVMTPALSMDDIATEKARSVLIQDTYMTSTQRAMRDGVSTMTRNIQAPFPGVPACANPISLRPLRPPYVSPEWRMDSVPWDGRQLRANCNPDKEFYLARIPKCSVCRVSSYLKSQKKK